MHHKNILLIAQTPRTHERMRALQRELDVSILLATPETFDEAIKSDIFTIEDIKNIGRQYGQDHNLGSDLSIEEVYPAIAGKMLNGMPCDRVEEMLDSTEDSFRWRDRLDIHADYWEPYGRSSKDFYQIRTSVIEGLLGQSDISYTWNGENEFELRRK